MKRSKAKPQDYTRLSQEKNPVNPVKKFNIDDIVNDFGERLLKGEQVSIDDILKTYPKLAGKLKPMLEAEMVLVEYGQKMRKEISEHKDELWKKLEKRILEKQKKQIEAQLTQLITHKPITLKLRAEFIPMILYVKGKSSRIGEGIRGITRFIKLLFLLDKETDLGKLVKVFYEFVPYKIGPFEPAIYQDLQVLEMAGVVKKQSHKIQRFKDSKIERLDDAEIDEGFNGNNIAAFYTLTDKGMKYAKALIDWADKKDPEIAVTLRKYKTYYAQAPLKKLLEYIYKKYPDFTTESEIIEKIVK
jgi:predicted transcriptional regulator